MFCCYVSYSLSLPPGIQAPEGKNLIYCVLIYPSQQEGGPVGTR